MGGTERAAQNFSIGYRNQGCEVKVLGLNGLGVRAGLLRQDGIEVFDGVENRADVLAHLKKWNPDIIHIHRSGFANAEMMDAVSFLKKDNNRVLETNVFARPDYSKASGLIDVHLQLSQWCLWKWKHWTANIRPLPLGAVVPYPVDVEGIVKIKSKVSAKHFENIPPDAFILGRVGQPLISKWDGIIFDALQDLLKEDELYFMVLIGLPEELKQKLTTYPEQVRSHVILLPTTNSEAELGTLYKSFHCFVHAAAIGESFGMVLAEALLYECPVISLSTPLKDNSQLEVVGHEKGGLIVDDKDNMVAAIRRLKADETLRRQYGQQGCNFVADNYNLQTITSSALKIARLALASENKQQLQQHLLADENIIPEINTSKIILLANNISGRLSFFTKIKMMVIHHPTLYWLFVKLRHGQ